MSSPKVKCTVEQCTHFMAGDQCMAAKISIYNTLDGNSISSEYTQCKSFHNRKTIDDVVGVFHNANVGRNIMAPFMDGTQITPELECYVDNCKYWDNGNRCTVGAIHGIGIDAARNEDTDCKTFEESNR